ncbi:MAG: aminotransferase class V-fold PLP-dependent enzyme [Acidimicrobiia bacterium]|nr:aminotransferase class V-fold PLP-dependent enzyme [Acidimicrobiia bacterium]
MEEWLDRAREDFPYLNGRIYLNSAGAGLAWRGQTVAASRYYDGAARMGADGQLLWEEQGARARDRVARLLDVPLEDVGFYRNTSEVLNLAANSIAWQAGDEVVVAKDDFPSVQWPWVKAEEAGGKIIRVDPVAEDLREQQLLDALSPRTRVLAVTHVHTVTGTRLDLARLGRACRQVGALLVVDGIQALGAIALDLTYVDVYASAVFKWMLSGFGVGIGVFRERARTMLTPAYRGYRNAPPSSALQYADPSYPGLYVLDATLEYLEQIGWPVIYERVDQLAGRVVDAVADAGITQVTSASARAGIVTIRIDDPAGCVERLRGKSIHVVAKLGLVRISPHFYNTTEDVNRFAEVLAADVDAAIHRG